MNEFIFGSLATTEKRVKYAQERLTGVWHDSQLEPRVPLAGESPRIRVTVALTESVERVVCALHEPEQAEIELAQTGVEWDLLNWRYYGVWEGRLPARPEGTLVRYKIYAYPTHSREPVAADQDATFAYLVSRPEAPDWASQAVIYQIFPDRFHPGQGRDWRQAATLRDIHGGTIRGIIEQLDYVADLGFNCIWLNPFFPDDTHHGYHATDYFNVNPRLGSNEDIKELVEEAHRRGIRLLLDFVANHWGRRHPTFQEAQADKESDYYHWYHWREWPHDYRTFFDVRELPQINLDYRPARRYMFKAARHWLAEVGFDGFRLDYALGPSLDFWTEFRAEVKEARPDAWLFGEVVETPATQLKYLGRLDGCLDFILMQALRDTFAFNSMNLTQFDNFLGLHEAYFPDYFSRPSFLDNHDMNRFLWLAGDDKRKLKLAALCQFTLSGPPIVYYGSEVGLSQEGNMVRPDGSHRMEECRRPMLWGEEQDRELRAYYRWLIELRHRHPVLHHGRRQTVYLDSEAGLYAYLRQDAAESLLVALNASDQPQQIKIEQQSLSLSPWSGEVVQI